METCETCSSRRNFLKLSGTSLFLLGLGRGAGLASALAPSTQSARRSVLVVFFQRGAADGLHMVAPYRESRYRGLRGGLALPEPGKGENDTRDAGDGFAFHPALARLHALYSDRKLAVVHAVGSPDTTRSHFDAQDYMESGTPGNKGTRDGWLNRALGLMDASAPSSPFRAVALTSTMPRSLAGKADAIAMQDFGSMRARDGNASLAERIETLYKADPAPDFQKAGEEAFNAIEMFRKADPLGIPARAGVKYGRGRDSEGFRQLACLIKADLGVRVAFLDGGGWDTHFNQGAATGQMSNNLRQLSDNISALVEDVGDVPVTVMTMTEFGRTAAINGAGGTDHGHGTAMFVAGAGVNGGRVLGQWPGLGSDLYEGRDLAVTTDFRDLFSEVAVAALGLPKDAALFPGYTVKGRTGVMKAA
ncbi:MAG: DUF1501 domain-containing protein [Acidobacteriota bacterium]